MAPLSNEGGKRTGVSPSSQVTFSPTSMYPQVPVTRYPAGSPHFSPGPRWTTTQPSATFSYLPSTSPSSSSFHRSLPPLSSRRGSSPSVRPRFSSGPRSMTQLSPVLSSLPPSPPVYTSFPSVSLGPMSMTQPSPVFSSLPPSPPVYTSCPSVSLGPMSMTQPSPVLSSLPPLPVYSSYPPVTPSPSSVCPPPIYPPPLARVENRDSSIVFNKNPSALPPRVPVTRSNSMSVPGSSTLLPRKFHKRTNSDIIGTNSTIPPESSYLHRLSNMLVGDTSCHNEDAVEWNYNDEAKKEFFKESMILDNNNASNLNENVDELMITFANLDGENNENAFNFKLGNGGEYTAAELKKISKSTKLTEVASNPNKLRRILSNQESASSSKQRKSWYGVDLERRVDKVEIDTTSMSRKMAVFEKDKMMMASENKEMKIRIESLVRQGQLRDALNEQLRIEIERLKEATTLNEQQLKEAIALIEQLTAEVQQLKVARGEVMQNHGQFDGSNMQPLDANMFQQLNIDDQFIQPQQNLDFYGLQI